MPEPMTDSPRTECCAVVLQLPTEAPGETGEGPELPPEAIPAAGAAGVEAPGMEDAGEEAAGTDVPTRVGEVTELFAHRPASGQPRKPLIRDQMPRRKAREIGHGVVATEHTQGIEAAQSCGHDCVVHCWVEERGPVVIHEANRAETWRSHGGVDRDKVVGGGVMPVLSAPMRAAATRGSSAPAGPTRHRPCSTS